MKIALVYEIEKEEDEEKFEQWVEANAAQTPFGNLVEVRFNPDGQE